MTKSSPRILFAGLFHETNTFVEGKTSLADFAILHGDEMLASAGDSSPLGGALEAAQCLGWEILPTVDFRAPPSAMVKDDVVETFWSEFKTRSASDLARGIDAIYLVLHGAMTSESLDDVEGEILERIRQLPGAERIPIFGVFDLHANFTGRMAQHSSCLVAYRENPHTDARAAAQLAVQLLQRTLATGEIPKTFWQHPPLMWPPTGTGSASEPMLSLEKLAREIEAESKEISCVNVIAGFSFSDVPETGVSFTVVTTGSEASARPHLRRLSQLAIRNGAAGNVTEPSIDDVMVNHRQWPPGLTVLAEPSDNIGGGAPGDGTGILRALIHYEISNAAVCINDPEAARELAKIAIGGKIILSLGGKGSALDAGAVELEAELISRSGGRFELEDKQSHLASISGSFFDMGSCGVVRHKGIVILITSNKTPPFDLGQWRSQGIEPTALSVIGVKAAVAHRRAYDSIAKQMLWVDTPGPCRSNLQQLPYRKVRRPIYPLNPCEPNL